MTNRNSLSVSKRSILIGVTLAVVLGVLNTCTPSPSTTVLEVTQIAPDAIDLSTVNITESQTVTNQISQVKTFDQCASASPLKAKIQFSSSSRQGNQRELVLTASVGGQIGLTPAIAAQLEGEIKRRIDTSITAGHEEEVEIEVPARSRQEYSIVWQESRREGTVQYVENGETKTASYSYRIGLELNSSTVRDLSCPGQPAGGTAPTVPDSESPVEAPTQASPVAEGGDTAVPTALALPVSSLLLPFEDSFDGGLRPEWQVISGQPVVANGNLKPAGIDWLTMQVGDSSLGENFTISVDWNWECHAATITLGEKVRFRFVGYGFHWEAFHENEWITLQYDNAQPCEGNTQFKVSGGNYTLLNNGEQLLTGTYEETSSGPITVAIDSSVTIDNFRITSP